MKYPDDIEQTTTLNSANFSYGWTVPWAILSDTAGYYLHKEILVDSTAGGTFTMFVCRKNGEFYANLSKKDYDANCIGMGRRLRDESDIPITLRIGHHMYDLGTNTNSIIDSDGTLAQVDDTNKQIIELEERFNQTSREFLERLDHLEKRLDQVENINPPNRQDKHLINRRIDIVAQKVAIAELNLCCQRSPFIKCVISFLKRIGL